MIKVSGKLLKKLNRMFVEKIKNTIQENSERKGGTL